jgi:hypothetical protein
MFRWLFSIALFLAVSVDCGAQAPAPSAAPAATPASNTANAPAQSSSDSPAKVSDGSASPSVAAGTGATKKVWTNENLRDANGNVSVVGDKRNQKYNMTPVPTADSATVTRIRQNLQKLQDQLDDVNKQITAYKQFEEGETVPDSGQDISKGYTRTPVNQQIAKLQGKKKDLQTKIDELIDEARKKGVEPGQLR